MWSATIRSVGIFCCQVRYRQTDAGRIIAGIGRKGSDMLRRSFFCLMTLAVIGTPNASSRYRVMELLQRIMPISTDAADAERFNRM